MPQPQTKSVIRLGNVGTLSGPVGSIGVGMLQATQAWVKDVNARGGLNGHPVELIAVDDGGDPARYRAGLQDLAENKKVLAFVNNAQELTGASGNDYLNARRIPVIGVTGGETWAKGTPMIFPLMPVGRPFFNTIFASTAQQAVAQGKKSYGILACTEAQACREFYDIAEEEVSKRGMTLVYKGQVSLAQPDFTAECLSAKNAGVEALLITADGNTLRRVAASCARQSYRPLFASASTVLEESMLKDSNLDGLLIANSPVAPAWFQSSTPATLEFQAVMRKYGVRAGGFHAQAWPVGKLLEKVAAHIGEPPTTAAILEGLYSIRKDDLGGLTTPISFVPDQPAALPLCWWNVTIRKGAWATPDGFKRSCD